MFGGTTRPLVAFDAEDLVVAAESRAALEDNRAKLGKSGLDDRYLFVWVNVWELGANAAFAMGIPRRVRQSCPAKLRSCGSGA